MSISPDNLETKNYGEEQSLREEVRAAVTEGLSNLYAQLDRIEVQLSLLAPSIESRAKSVALSLETSPETHPIPQLVSQQSTVRFGESVKMHDGGERVKLSETSAMKHEESVSSHRASHEPVHSCSFVQNLKRHYHFRQFGPGSLSNLGQSGPSGIGKRFADSTTNPHTDFGSVTTTRSNAWIQEAMFRARLENQGKWFQWLLYKTFLVHTWWHSLEEPRRHGALAIVVKSSAFEVLCVAVIIFNSIFIARAADSSMDNLGSDDFSKVDWVEDCLLLFYTVELGLRLGVHRMFFFVGDACGWNVFDFLLVANALVEKALRLASASPSGNAVIMRTFRILKLARALRAVRAIRFCKELLNLLSSMQKSLVALWSLVLVVLALYIFSVVFLQALTEELQDRNCLDESCDEYGRVRDAFGSMGRAMLSLCMAMTGGENWSIYYDVLETAGGFYAVLFLIFIFFIMFALVNVMAAIFVEKALEASKPDEHGKILEQRRKNIEDAETFRGLCYKIVGDGKNTISMSEFVQAMEDEALLMHLAAIGLEVHDVRLFFSIVAGAADEDEVSIDRFVEGCMQMSGSATAIDMQRQLYQLGVIHSDMKMLGHLLLTNLPHASADADRKPQLPLKPQANTKGKSIQDI